MDNSTSTELPLWQRLVIVAVALLVVAPLFYNWWASEQTRNDTQESAVSLERRDYAGAIEHANGALERTPDYWPAYTLRGYAYFQQGNLDQALADLDQAVALGPNKLSASQLGRVTTDTRPYAVPLMYRGLVHLKRGEVDQAEKDLSAANSYNRLDGQISYLLGQVALQRGHYAQAVDKFGLALNVGIPSDDIYYYQGEAYFQLGQWQSARASFEKYLDTDKAVERISNDFPSLRDVPNLRENLRARGRGTDPQLRAATEERLQQLNQH